MANKKIGIKSSAQDNFLEPNAVTSLTVTDVGTNKAYGSGEASLSWSLPAASPPATLYTITTSPATTTQTTTNTSYTFTGLTAGSYTFTVVASNNAGSSQPTTSASTAITTVPATMSAPTASSPNANQDVVSWTAPANGGKSITGYTITSSDGPTYSAAAGATSITINETANTSQTYRIYATNGNGNGAQSANSNSVTTTAPFFPPFFPYFPPYFPYFPPYFPFFPFFPPFFPYFPPFFPYFPPFFPYFPFFPPFFPYFPPYFPYFPPYFPYFPFFPPYFAAPPYFPPFFKSFKCISGDTLILTVTNGWVPAADIKVGEKLFTLTKEAMNNGENLKDFTITGSNFTETEVVNVEVSKKTLVQFNDLDAKFSDHQPVFVKVGDSVTYKNTGEIEIGDVLVWIEEDPSSVSYVEVTKITKTEDEHDVYDIRTSDTPWYIAGHILTIA
jgi:hypothetical protein